jgi:hypothetical protein
MSGGCLNPVDVRRVAHAVHQRLVCDERHEESPKNNRAAFW